MQRVDWKQYWCHSLMHGERSGKSSVNYEHLPQGFFKVKEKQKRCRSFKMPPFIATKQQAIWVQYKVFLERKTDSKLSWKAMDRGMNMIHIIWCVTLRKEKFNNRKLRITQNQIECPSNMLEVVNVLFNTTFVTKKN